MHWQSRRKQFRQHLLSGECLYPASVYDPLSARMAVELDCKIGMFAGSVASLTVLGDPDLILLTLTEFADQAYRINRSAELPLLVDADHGYGNALNVRRTVEELETAGVAALSIEDTHLPKPHALTNSSAMITIEEGVGKMQAAVDARQDSDLVIAARTSAVKLGGVDEAIARIEAYQDTGVDMIFLIGIQTKSDLEKIAQVCRLPMILGGAGAEIKDLDYLSQLGVSICLQGHQPVMAAIQSAYETMKALKNGVSPAELPIKPDKEMISRLSREGEFAEWMNRFLES
ncbi:MAG: isocitrate lyase/PEP mutase family protein [Pseudomonadota bacterium]